MQSLWTSITSSALRRREPPSGVRQAADASTDGRHGRTAAGPYLVVFFVHKLDGVVGTETPKMPESNHAALGQGLKLFTDAMRRLAKERLIARYPNSWWESGVVARLTDVQRNTLRRDIDKDPNRDRVDLLEPAHFVRIVTQEFDHAFHGVFTEGGFADFKKTQSWLQAVATARNEWAHPRTGDMLADDVAHALYSMTQILSAAQLPAAGEVERVRKGLLGIDPAPAPQAPASPFRWLRPGRASSLTGGRSANLTMRSRIRPPSMSRSLPPLWAACTPARRVPNT